MNYFYSASVMGYGNGRKWHKMYNFPNFIKVTKTITMEPITGIPFAILKFGNTVWNKVGLHNVGFKKWYYQYNYKLTKKERSNIIVSLAGTDDDIQAMVYSLEYLHINGIELNFSCPNYKDFENKVIPVSKHPIYLKLRYNQDPYKYELDKINGIRLNSIPTKFGGLSGKAAKKKNWEFIKKFNKEGLNVAGCSFSKYDDLIMLENFGCGEIGIGVVILTNPLLVESL